MSVLAAVAAISFASLDRELPFYDAGAYLVTAKALATGAGYRNLNLPGAPPQGLYPPGVPVLFAVAWRVWPNFPANLIVMRGAVVFLGLAFLAAAWAYAVRAGKLNRLEATAVVALIGLHPVFLAFTTEITSEIPYALMSIVALYAYARFLETDRPPWFAMMTAGCVLAVLTRTIGAALVVGIVVDALWRRRLRFAAALAVISALPLGAWSLWSWHARSAYSAYPPEIAANYRGYVANLASTDWLGKLHRALQLNVTQFIVNWSSFVAPWLPTALAVAAVIFLMHPIPRRVWRERRVHDWYCAGAFAMTVLWPWPLNSRFVLVLSPFLIAYCLEGLRDILERLPKNRRRPLMAFVLAAMVVGAVAQHASSIAAAAGARAAAASTFRRFHEMAEWIKMNTPADAVVVAGSDPAYYLFTDRRTVRLAYPDPFAVYYDPVGPARFEQPEKTLAWLRAINGCYIVKDPLLGRAESDFYAGLADSLQHAPSGSMVRLHASPDGSFELFRLQMCGP